MSYNQYDLRVRGLISPLPWRCELGNNWFDADGKKIAEANHSSSGDWGEYPKFYKDIDATFWYGWQEARDSLIMAPGLRLHENEMIRQIRQDAENDGYRSAKTLEEQVVNDKVEERVKAFFSAMLKEIKNLTKGDSGNGIKTSL